MRQRIVAKIRAEDPDKPSCLKREKAYRKLSENGVIQAEHVDHDLLEWHRHFLTRAFTWEWWFHRKD